MTNIAGCLLFTNFASLRTGGGKNGKRGTAGDPRGSAGPRPHRWRGYPWRRLDPVRFERLDWHGGAGGAVGRSMGSSVLSCVPFLFVSL